MSGAAYPNPYDLLTRRRGYVLLLPYAGVWVGTSEILPTHPAKAGGFCFHPLYKLGAGAGRTFGIFGIRNQTRRNL